MRKIVAAVLPFIALATVAGVFAGAREFEFKVNIIVKNTRAYIDNTGTGLMADGSYDLYSGSEKVGSVRILEVSKYFTSAEITDGRGTIREGEAYRFVMRRPPVEKPVAGGLKFTRSDMTVLPEPVPDEKKAEKKEKKEKDSGKKTSKDKRRVRKESAEDAETGKKKKSTRKKSAGKRADRKKDRPKKKDGTPDEEKSAKKAEAPERKPEQVKKKVEPPKKKYSTPGIPMLNESMTSGLVSIPNALTVGKRRRVGGYSYRKTDHSFAMNMSGYISRAEYREEFRLNQYSFTYGPGRRSEISVAYAPGRRTREITYYGNSPFITLPSHQEESDNMRLTTVNAKYRFDGWWAWRVRAALAAEYTNERREGDPEDNLFAAAVVDIPIAWHATFITLLYGLEDAGDENIIVRAAGVTIPVMDGLQFCAEYRQMEYYIGSWSDPSDWKFSSLGLQYRLDDDYSIGASYTTERGGEYEMYHASESEYYRLYILHNSSGRILKR
ncbi:hypothetical protein ACFLQK_01720 [bacterium]